MHITKWKKQVWKGYILYDFNYMILWKRQHQEWTVMETKVFGWLCVSVGSSVLTDVPFGWGLLLMGEATDMWGQEVYRKSVSSSKFHCEPKTILKI